MKKLIAAVFCLMSFNAMAGNCFAAYAVGLSHFLKNEADVIAEEFSPGKVVEDEYTRLAVEEGQVVAVDKTSEAEIKMRDISQDDSMTFMVSEKRLANHPDPWTGSVYGAPFLMVLCQN